MARGDGGKVIFEDDEDAKAFLFRLGEVCQSHGWRVHAWVLMSNHFHLLLETPEANLVTGMKWLLGTFSQGWNFRRLRRGHVWQGRYKSVPVSAQVDSPYYFRIVADYIHLNPARAGLVGVGGGKRLISYAWSSLPDYARGSGAEWLCFDRVLGAFDLSKDGRGRRAYVAWLEARAQNGNGEIDQEATKALRRGWYLGEPSFGDRLRSLVEKGKNRKLVGKDPLVAKYDEDEAEDLVARFSQKLGLPEGIGELCELRKGDERKVKIAVLVKQRTSVSNRWISERLGMGHVSSVSRLVGEFKKSRKAMKDLKAISKESCS